MLLSKPFVLNCISSKQDVDNTDYYNHRRLMTSVFIFLLYLYKVLYVVLVTSCVNDYKTPLLYSFENSFSCFANE